MKDLAELLKLDIALGITSDQKNKMNKIIRKYANETYIDPKDAELINEAFQFTEPQHYMDKEEINNTLFKVYNPTDIGFAQFNEYVDDLTNYYNRYKNLVPSEYANNMLAALKKASAHTELTDNNKNKLASIGIVPPPKVEEEKKQNIEFKEPNIPLGNWKMDATGKYPTGVNIPIIVAREKHGFTTEDIQHLVSGYNALVKAGTKASKNLKDTITNAMTRYYGANLNTSNLNIKNALISIATVYPEVKEIFVEPEKPIVAPVSANTRSKSRSKSPINEPISSRTRSKKTD